MNILFFDILITGHHTEYINHIVEHLVANNNAGNRYFFVVHQEFKTKFSHIIKKAENFKNIEFIEVKPEETLNLNVSNRVLRSLRNFNLVDKYAKRLKTDVCYLLHINVFQIAIGLKRVNYKIRGILFMQFTNMEVNSIKKYYKYIRRYFPFLLLKRSSNIDAVFLLNDKSSCEMLNEKFKKDNVFRYLPDPIPHFTPEKDFSIRDKYKIDGNRKIFLHFGALSNRKGTIEIVEAVAKLPKKDQENVAVLIAGRPSDAVFGQNLKEAVAKTESESTAQIILENNFVTEEQMASLFQQSDFVLMPYKNPEASSGILGHAMFAHKKIIGPSNGLIGSMIEKYKLGIGIDDITPHAIADAMGKIDAVVINPEIYDDFIKEHSPDKFVSSLLCL